MRKLLRYFALRAALRHPRRFLSGMRRLRRIGVPGGLKQHLVTASWMAKEPGVGHLVTLLERVEERDRRIIEDYRK